MCVCVCVRVFVECFCAYFSLGIRLDGDPVVYAFPQLSIARHSSMNNRCHPFMYHVIPLQKKVRSNVQRALSVLGSVCRNTTPSVGNGEWVERHLAGLDEPDIPKAISWDVLIEASYGLFSAFLAKRDVETKCSALKALTGIFVSRPRILLLAERNGTIADLMVDTVHPEIKIQALRCWKEILVVRCLIPSEQSSSWFHCDL